MPSGGFVLELSAARPLGPFRSLIGRFGFLGMSVTQYLENARVFAEIAGQMTGEGKAALMKSPMSG